MALRLEGHSIELERLMAKEIVKNRRLLGPNDPHTQEQELGLKGMSVRRLTLVKGGRDHFGFDWRFIRYKDGGAKCVLVPMKSPQDFKGGKDYVEGGKEFKMDTAEMPVDVGQALLTISTLESQAIL